MIENFQDYKIFSPEIFLTRRSDNGVHVYMEFVEVLSEMSEDNNDSL